MKTLSFFLKMALFTALLCGSLLFQNSCKPDDDMSGNIVLPDDQKFKLNFSTSLSSFFLVASTNENEIILDTLLTPPLEDFLINYPKTQKLNITVGNTGNNGSKIQTVTGVESGFQILRNSYIPCDNVFINSLNIVKLGSLYIDDLPAYEALYSPSTTELNLQYNADLEQLKIRGRFEEDVDHVVTIKFNGEYLNYTVAAEDWMIEEDGDYLLHVSFNEFQTAEILEISSELPGLSWVMGAYGLQPDSTLTNLASWSSTESNQHDDEQLRIFLPSGTTFTDYQLSVVYYEGERSVHKFFDNNLQQFPMTISPANITIDLSNFAEKSYQLNHSAEVDLVRAYYYFPFVNNRKTYWEVYHLADVHAQFNFNILTPLVFDNFPELNADLNVPEFAQVDLYDFEGDITAGYLESSIYALRKLDCLPYTRKSFYKDF